MRLFITGTDTGIGKTHVSMTLLQAFNKKGYSTLGIKPVASGCDKVKGKLFNKDALILQKHSSIKIDYHLINPFAFEPPIAPNIAATKAQESLTVTSIIEKTAFAMNYPADICIVEGVGGWHVPLNDNETMVDFVKKSNLKVILVVGMKLGCLNHAILSYQAIRSSKVPFLGWIANCIDENMKACEENIETLQGFLQSAPLEILKYQQNQHETKL